jgi:glycosyltransferase involved in cell wall biosynthesis
MSAMDHPRVSVGVPVYNGADTLSEALDSLLGQDYPNLEVIVSDNASTDGTEALCQSYAARDPRVVYHRAAWNRGAVWNFNRVVGLASGPYFMWAAADDTRAPSCVRSCVDRLEADPGAVLCYPRISVVTPSGTLDDVMAGIDLTRPAAAERLAAMLRAEWWKWGLAFYGLIRTEALRATGLCENRYGFDFDVVLKLCLQGRCARAGDTVFYYRKMRVREDDRAAYRRIMATLSPLNRPHDPPPAWLHTWLTLLHFAAMVAGSKHPAAEKARLMAAALRHGFLTRTRALELRYAVASVTGLRFAREQFRGWSRHAEA